MTITAEQLKLISPGTPLVRCELFAPHLNNFCPKYLIDTPVEMASFLSQVLHESGGFKWMKEIWGPTKQQLRYERDFTQLWTSGNQRNGLAFDLGNSEKGDGKKMAGVGAIQTTGRANIKRMSLEMFGDESLLKDPSVLSMPQYAIQSACIYWKWRKMDLIDDDLFIKEETKKVNGGYNGLEERQHYFDRAIKILK
jgi:putative chitinase